MFTEIADRMRYDKILLKKYQQVSGVKHNGRVAALVSEIWV